MNAPHDPSDPLFESLAEEAADLPARAARAARQRKAQRRQNRQRLTQVAFVALVAVSTWQLMPENNVQPTTAATDHVVTEDEPMPTLIKHAPEPDDAPLAPFPTKRANPGPRIVNVAATLPLPSGLNEEQAEFVKSLPDAPLLFIRDDSGKVTRIHLVER